jgi:hypothetical protein
MNQQQLDFLNEMATGAAYKIARVLREFENIPNVDANMSRHIVMQHVNRILNGDPVIIEGEELVKEVNET